MLAAPAHAATLNEQVALRAALRVEARASGRTALQPLADAPASATRDLARIGRSDRRVHVLVGLRSRTAATGVRRKLARLGARTRTFDSIAVLYADAPSGAALADALRGDRRVAYVERDRRLRAAADPFNAIDPQTGINFIWAYDAVHAGEAIAAAGGGSQREVAVIDTGLDTGHPDIAPNVGATFDTLTGTTDVTDRNGHGTFVAGLIAAVPDNNIGGKGVAGNTKLVPIRASFDGSFSVADVIAGIQLAVRAHADVVNMSLAGSQIDATQIRALDAVFLADVLPVAASGNTGEDGNDRQFPAAAIGGVRGGRGTGLSVAATNPDGSVASFSTHNDRVSLAAPGASADCQVGVFSTIPRGSASEWDNPPPGTCPSRVFATPTGRFAYGQGTSFSAPIAAGIASLVWQVQPRLASEQVADVLRRSAHQTRPGGRWNEFTGAGIVDGKAATDLARAYDVRDPKARARARRRGAKKVAVRVSRVKDRTDPGHELAGHLKYSLLVSRDGGRRFAFAVRPRSHAFTKTVRLRGRRANVLVSTVCDGNGNCGVKRLGRFKARR
jgi:subtilisin family serine protease